MVSGSPDVRPSYRDATGEDNETLRTVQAILAEVCAEAAGVAPDAVDPGSNVAEFAASSLRLLQFHGRLEDAFGIEIAASAFFDHETVAALAGYLAGLR
jgi:acyl carrier protein